ITVRDNGYQVTRVSDLRTGTVFPFTQANGSITVSGITTWDPYDTVLKVETTGRVGIYPDSSITASASASASGHPASALIDRDDLDHAGRPGRAVHRPERRLDPVPAADRQQHVGRVDRLQALPQAADQRPVRGVGLPRRRQPAATAGALRGGERDAVPGGRG